VITGEPAHGEVGCTARLVLLRVDGLIYASSMVMLDSGRRKTPVPALARWLLGLGIAATLAASVAHGLGHGPAGAMVAEWPAVALDRSYEISHDGHPEFPGTGRRRVQQQARCRPATGTGWPCCSNPCQVAAFIGLHVQAADGYCLHNCWSEAYGFLDC
jgi:hypothetical protein